MKNKDCFKCKNALFSKSGLFIGCKIDNEICKPDLIEQQTIAEDELCYMNTELEKLLKETEEDW